MPPRFHKTETENWLILNDFSHTRRVIFTACSPSLIHPSVVARLVGLQVVHDEPHGRSNFPDCYVVGRIRFLLWRRTLCGAVVEMSANAARTFKTMPHSVAVICGPKARRGNQARPYMNDVNETKSRPDYSSRSARMGSAAAARHAGRNMAAQPTSPSSNATPKNVTGSFG